MSRAQTQNWMELWYYATMLFHNVTTPSDLELVEDYHSYAFEVCVHLLNHCLDFGVRISQGLNILNVYL